MTSPPAMSADTAPAAMPGEEDVARVLCEHDCLDWDLQGNFLTSGSGGDDRDSYLSSARAVLALFAPILAEKERLTEDVREKLHGVIGAQSRQMDLLNKRLRHAEARALAAEAALAAERERKCRE